MKSVLRFIVIQYLFVCSVIMVSNSELQAQWSHDPRVNNLISSNTSSQLEPVITGDGSGGAIVAYQDYRDLSWNIFAQRINASGVVQWTSGGVEIGGEYHPAITSDGAGGAIIAWQGYNNGGDIYAQRINASGVVQWTANGVAICSATNEQNLPAIISDGSGGSIIAWEDNRNGNMDIYAQRINASGVVQWTMNGVAICTATGYQGSPAVIDDGTGGAIVTWTDVRSGTSDIYSQRVNASGVVQWTTNGVAICTETNNQSSPSIVKDELRGAVIAWNDYRSGPYSDIYVQRINASGEVKWAANGVAICTATNGQENVKLVSNASGGAILTWEDNRNGSDWDIYIQIINALGVLQGATDGVALCTTTDFQYNPTITGDSAGGAVVTWQDRRSGADDIYAQRINALAVAQWTTDGIALCTATNGQYSPKIIGDCAGGAIITWQDGRSGLNNIYTQNIDRYGYLGDVGPHIRAVEDIKNDQGGKITLMWNASYLDAMPSLLITNYTLYRGVKPDAATAGSIVLSPQEYFERENQKPASKNSSMLSSVFFKMPRTVGSTDTIYWQNIGNVIAEWLDGYSFDIATPSDSGPQGIPWNYFMVRAKTYDYSTFWSSIPDSGYSVDNLSPASILALSADIVEESSVYLHWNQNTTDPDVGVYEVHRSLTSGFIPSLSTMIGQTADSLLTDSSPSIGQINYYKVVTVDIHGNKSAPSSEVSVDVTTLITQAYNVQDRWNIVSVPLTLNNYNKSSVYPTAVSDAFAYEGSYVVRSTLVNGKGYWLKFNGSQSIPMTGYVRTSDTIPVQQGWNIIGSISSPVATSSITSNPGGIATSQFFGYNNGYSPNNTIEPGKAYWVKVSQSGELHLSPSFTTSTRKINIVPTDELPPSPPDDFSDNNNTITPREFSLEQNYPNPFNPLTVIRYQLSVNSFVTLKIYDLLGREVATLVNDLQVAGYMFVGWNASECPSGIYYYKLQTENFSDTKKLLLVK